MTNAKEWILNFLKLLLVQICGLAIVLAFIAAMLFLMNFADPVPVYELTREPAGDPW